MAFVQSLGWMAVAGFLLQNVLATSSQETEGRGKPLRRLSTSCSDNFICQQGLLPFQNKYLFCLNGITTTCTSLSQASSSNYTCGPCIATIKPRNCQRQNPLCGMTAAEAQMAFLSSYEQLVARLDSIYKLYQQNLAQGVNYSDAVIQWGPLIANGDNGGLLNIDIPLSSVCNATIANCSICGTAILNPTVRQATICSVQYDSAGFPTRGNLNASQIGRSSHGRNIMAMRVGNRVSGTRVFLSSQIHGNEAASTEAYLNVLEDLVRHPQADVLSNLDILFVLRGNPDGGEPTASNLANDYLAYFRRERTFNESAYFFRHNVNPSAGGNFGQVPDGIPLSEPDFFGVVGRGYDLNRYTYTGFNRAIRPVESQAIVSALYAFRPQVAYDAHGDTQKTFCTTALTSFRPKIDPYLGVVAFVMCRPPAPSAPTMSTAREYMVEASVLAHVVEGDTAIAKSQALAGMMAQNLGSAVKGEVIRFSQAQASNSVGKSSGGSIGAGALRLGAIVAGVEVSNFANAWRPATQKVEMSDTGNTTSEVNGIDLHLIEPCFLIDNICLHEIAVETLLHGIVAVVVAPAFTPSPVFCNLPVKHNLVAEFPANLGWARQYVRNTSLIPSGGQFHIPSDVSGVCPGDSSDSIPARNGHNID